MPKPDIIHRGKNYSRTTRDDYGAKTEKAFADQWEARNATDTFNAPIAAVLLCTRPSEERMAMYGIEQFRELTQEMATDAATIIQWLGTNVGFCFLEEALGRVGMKIVRKDREGNHGPEKA